MDFWKNLGFCFSQVDSCPSPLQLGDPKLKFFFFCLLGYSKLFLLDLTLIIAIGYACQQLTNCRLVNLMDVTLACEDTCSKHVEVVTVADVSDEDHVGNSLLIWKLRFGHND